MPSSSSATASPPSRLTLFALLFAWANLLHQLTFREWLSGGQPLGWLVFGFAVALSLRPSSFPLLGGLLVTRVATTASWMPMIRGHLFLEGLLALGVGVALVLRCRALGKWRGFGRDEQEALFDAFAPLLRGSALLIYFAVTLAKLNWQFFDPSTSAAVQFLYWTAEQHPFVPTDPWMRTLAIAGTLGAEGGIPVLLCFARTRWLGLVQGLAFHTMLGLTPLGIASFTLVMFLVLFPWMPRHAPEVWFDAFHAGASPRADPAEPARRARRRGARDRVRPCPPARRQPAARPGVRGPRHLVVADAVAAALWAIRAEPGEPTRALLATRSRWTWAFLAFLAFNVACPYLGLKTRSSLSMHANLRTEKGHWNHVFLPESLRVFGYQDELVTVLESDPPDLAHLQKWGMELPYFEFRRWVRLAQDDFHVVYRDPAGEVRRFEKQDGVGSDPAPMEASPLLEWFLCFNPVGASHDYIPELVSRVGPARNVVPRFRVGGEPSR